MEDHFYAAPLLLPKVAVKSIDIGTLQKIVAELTCIALAFIPSGARIFSGSLLMWCG